MNVCRKMIYISFTLTVFFLFSLIYITNQDTAFQVISTNDTSPLWIIDAGHGGEDGGAIAIDGTYEKDINLKIAQQLQVLGAMFGVDNIMIRTTDTDLADHSLNTVRERKITDIKARMNIINKHTQAVYIGIHQNQYTDSSISGLQVFYSNNTDAAVDIAQSIQNYTSSTLQPDNTRKAKAAGKDIYLLYHAEIPAIMVECGFISNTEECKLLQQADYGTKISLCIAAGLIRYYNTERIA